jgi:hypothetical protein
MTIEKTGSRAQYTGNGATVAFSFPFRFIAETDLQVFLTVGGVDTLQTLTTHYTVSNTGTEDGGTVAFLTAPATGARVTINRSVPITQETDYTANDPFPADTHEAALDKLTLAVQEQAAIVARSIKLPATSTISSIELSGAVANAAVVFNGDATGLVPGPTTADIANAAANAAQAALDAAAAEAAKNAAEAAAAILDGSAVPNGGTTGQVLAKASATDADTQWETLAVVARSGAYDDLSGKPTLGTAAALTAGTGANNAVQLDGDARLPAVDGRNLINVPLPAPYDSGELSITAGGGHTLPHGLGVRPRIRDMVFVCKTAEFGFEVGQEVDATMIDSTRASGSIFSIGVVAAWSTTQVKIRFGSTAEIPLLNLDTGVNAIGTSANWRLIVRAWA